MTALEWIVFALLVACLFWPRSQAIAKFARWLSCPARRARSARMGCASLRALRLRVRGGGRPRNRPPRTATDWIALGMVRGNTKWR